MIRFLLLSLLILPAQAGNGFGGTGTTEAHPPAQRAHNVSSSALTFLPRIQSSYYGSTTSTHPNPAGHTDIHRPVNTTRYNQKKRRHTRHTPHPHTEHEHAVSSSLSKAGGMLSGSDLKKTSPALLHKSHTFVGGIIQLPKKRGATHTSHSKTTTTRAEKESFPPTSWRELERQERFASTKKHKKKSWSKLGARKPNNKPYFEDELELPFEEESVEEMIFEEDQHLMKKLEEQYYQEQEEEYAASQRHYDSLEAAALREQEEHLKHLEELVRISDEEEARFWEEDDRAQVDEWKRIYEEEIRNTPIEDRPSSKVALIFPNHIQEEAYFSALNSVKKSEIAQWQRTYVEMLHEMNEDDFEEWKAYEETDDGASSLSDAEEELPTLLLCTSREDRKRIAQVEDQLEHTFGSYRIFKSVQELLRFVPACTVLENGFYNIHISKKKPISQISFEAIKRLGSNK